MIRKLSLAALALCALAAPALAGATPPELCADCPLKGGSGAGGLAFGLMLLGGVSLALPAAVALLRRLPLAGVALAGLLTLLGPALSAEVTAVANTAVVVPWGDWIVAIAQTITSVLVPILVTVITAAIARIAPWLQLFITQKRIQQMVEACLEYALNTVEGAARGTALNVEIGSKVLATAVNRALNAAPAAVVRAAGGPEGVARTIFRALHLEETANANTVLTPVLNGLPAAARK